MSHEDSFYWKKAVCPGRLGSSITRLCSFVIFVCYLKKRKKNASPKSMYLAALWWCCRDDREVKVWTGGGYTALAEGRF